MNSRKKNWIVYSIQLQFFVALTIITIFIEFVWLFEEIFFINLINSHPNTRTAIPSIEEFSISISFIIYMVLNLGVASFSLYAFIFILHVLDSNPAKTAPVCALATDCALINLFLYHFFIYKDRYFIYLAPHFPFSIYFYVPYIISQISEIFMIIAFFTIFLNLQFGIEGIYKSRILKTNNLTDFIHILMMINGVLPILFLLIYTNIFTINPISIIFSVIIAIFLIGLFNFILWKKNMRYPIEAISIWRHGKVITKKEKEELN
ncbi:MAG: hypothetical protein ACFFAH_13295 [Promethearchaeota archaeon]